MRTRKPCPLCKQVDYRRQVDEVCPDCKRRIEELERFHQHIMDHQELVPVCFADAPHWNASYYIPGYSSVRRQFNGDIRKAIYDLAVAVTVPAVDEKNEHGNAPWILGKADPGSSYNHDSRWYCLPAVRDALMALQKLIQPMLDEAYASGKRDGSNLLMRLAQGDLAVNEFVEKRKDAMQ